jgi:flagellar M-ring protein FliF
MQPELPEIGTAQTDLSWFARYWTTVGMLILGLASLLMLRSMVRALPTAPGAAPAPLPASTEREEAHEPAIPATASRPKRRLGKGPSLRDELVEMVREDPDAAANILKGWIGNPS